MIAIALAAAVAQTPPAAKPACQADPPVAARSDRTLRPRKLGELPDGVLMRAVLVTVDGCPAVEERRLTGSDWRWMLHVDGRQDRSTPADANH